VRQRKVVPDASVKRGGRYGEWTEAGRSDLFGAKKGRWGAENVKARKRGRDEGQGRGGRHQERPGGGV